MEQKEKIFFPYWSNSSLFMLLTITLVLLLVHFVTLNGRHLVPNTWQSFIEIIYDFVLNLVNEQTSGPSLIKQCFIPQTCHICLNFFFPFILLIWTLHHFLSYTLTPCVGLFYRFSLTNTSKMSICPKGLVLVEEYCSH